MKTSILSRTKMLFVAFCCVASVASVKAQATFSILPSATRSITLTCDASETLMEDSISNPTAGDLDLSYQVVSNTLLSSWTVMFCDWVNCLLTVPSGVKNISTKIPAGSHNESFIVHVTSNSNPGQGSLVLNLWQTSVPSNSVTITWIASACMSAGISEAANNTNFTAYPNPAQDFVNVEITKGYTQNSTVRVYNFVGEKMIEYTGIKSNVQKVDLSKLPEGMYFVKYSNEEGSSVKKILKTR